MSPLFFFLLIQNFYFINSCEFCSDDGMSLIKMIGNQMYEFRNCQNNYYYNIKNDQCVSKSDYFKPGVCGDLYDDPFEAKFEECRNFPHLTDCVKYYKCDYVNFIWKTCELDKFLNYETMECDAEECQVISADVEIRKFLCNSANVGKRKYERCNAFFQCSPVHKLSQCPYGMSFNLATNKCDLKVSENAHCNNRLISKIECNEWGAYSLKFDPTIFYICIPKNKKNLSEKQVIFRQCPVGKVFNETSENCDSI